MDDQGLGCSNLDILRELTEKLKASKRPLRSNIWAGMESGGRSNLEELQILTQELQFGKNINKNAS